MGLPDISIDIFTATAPGNGSFVYCTPFQARRALSGQKTTDADRVCLAGTITLGTATLITFVAECGPTDSGPWSPVGYFDTPTVATGVATAPLCAFRFTRAVAGLFPSASFSPDQSFVRFGVMANAADAAVTAAAFLSQQGA